MDSDHGSGVDHISGLPDELLHDILLRLDLTTPAAAARTNVLSHRWRHVWATLPDLFFGESDEDPQPNYSLDAIDGALAASSAPKLSSLYITIPMGLRVPAYRVASWLTFASQHIVDSLDLDICDSSSSDAEQDELELPTCERATQIALGLPFILRHSRNDDIGVFTVLTDLNIRGATMDGRELEDLVSLLCPRLKNIDLSVKLSTESNISIHSATLEHLSFIVRKACRLEVNAPILRSLAAGYPLQTYVAAPNLAEVVWDDIGREEELQFTFADSGRHLRLLDVRDCYAMAPLMRCFDTIHELKLHGLSLGTEGGYQSFLDDIVYLPRCEILHVSSFTGHRCYVPGILHLLKRVHGVRELVFDNEPVECYPSLLACPCRLPEGDIPGEINLCLVEKITINRFTGADEQMKLIDVLTSRCSAAKLQSLEITLADDVTQLSKEICEKIPIMCGPEVEVSINQVQVIFGEYIL